MARNTTPPSGRPSHGQTTQSRGRPSHGQTTQSRGRPSHGQTTQSRGSPTPGQRLVTTVEGMGSGAMGVARLDGFTLLIPRGLPEEEIEVEVERVHPRYALARPIRILRPSPERVKPPCSHFERCGGCDWQHVSYQAQLSFKRQVIEDQLTRIGKTEIPSGWEIIPSEKLLGYRDKLEFVPGGDELTDPAFHATDGRGRVPISNCLLAPVEFTGLARAALEYLQTIPPEKHRLPHPLLGLTRITVQGAASSSPKTAGLALTLHFGQLPTGQFRSSRNVASRNDAAGNAATENPLESIARILGNLPGYLSDRFPALKTLAISSEKSGNQKSRGGLKILLGEAEIFKKVGEWRYRAPLNGFFQVNRLQAARMVEAVIRRLEDAPSGVSGDKSLALDLFCGTGLFSLPLAAQGWRVVGIELQRDSVRAARKTALDWGLKQSRFEIADLARPGLLPGLLSGLFKEHGQPASILVNPPRNGLPKPLTDFLLESGVKQLIYISCDGGTFARDASRLAPRYRLEKMEGFDLFPQTHHLEMLGCFRKL